MRTRPRRRALLATAVFATAALSAVAPIASAVTTVPGQPTNLTVTADDQAVFVSWQPPASNGGAPIDYYRVIATDTATTKTTQRSISLFAPCVQCTTVYFSGLVNGDSYVFTVAAHNSTGLGLPTSPSASVTPIHVPFLADSWPQNVTATISGQTATVTWSPPANTNGLPIDRYLIQMNDRTLTPASGNVYYAGWKYACGTCTSVTFTGLSAADTYDFFVYAHNNGNATAIASYGSGGGSNRVTATDPSCPAGQVCVSVDGASNDGAIQWRADGFLHGLDFNGGTYDGPPAAMIQALHPTSWRVSGCTGTLSWLFECQWAAQNTSASLTNVLSDDYYGRTYDSNAKGMRPPWECWDCYTADVRSIVTQTGAVPASNVYWDLQNEPGFGLGPNQGGNYLLYLHQLLTAYQTVKAANPNLKIVLPSLDEPTDTTIGGTDGAVNPHVLTFDELLPFLVANNISPDALSWHENGGLFETNPAVFGYQVDKVRYLESEYGLPTAPKIFVNEYDPAYANLLPGWSAGWIAALEEAKVDQANRACWVESSAGTSYSECTKGSLDGLFTPTFNGQQTEQPQANYWVYRFYAGMQGDVLNTTTSDNTVTALATNDSTTQTIDLLVGRHKSCTAAVNPDCTTANAPEVGAIPTPAPATVNIAVAYPYAASTVTATVTDIANVRGAMSQPASTTTTLTVTNGVVTVPLAAVADGDAYTVVINPA
jgi:hypothetical protein